MYRLNKIYDNSSIVIKQLYPLFLTEKYHALCLEDFLENKNNLKITKALFPMGSFATGLSLITIPWVEINKINSYHSYIFDSSAEVIVHNQNPFSGFGKKQDIPYGKLFNPLLSYSRNYECLWLIDYENEIEKTYNYSFEKNSIFSQLNSVLPKKEYI
jgi:hypothetical protein